MSEKRPRWESEEWNVAHVPKDIICKDCAFQGPPVEIDGKLYERYTGGCCKKYEYPNSKPHDVLWKHGKCPYYETIQ
jgi:hypothetical protein